jgi:type I restriction enzyme M protein
MNGSDVRHHNASVALRQKLLTDCNLHTVFDCPGGTFQGAGMKTVGLFFEKGAPTRKVCFCQLDPGRNLGKTNPLNDRDLAEFGALQKTFADSPKSWSVTVDSIDPQSWDFLLKNSHGGRRKWAGPRLWRKPWPQTCRLSSLGAMGFPRRTFG